MSKISLEGVYKNPPGLDAERSSLWGRNFINQRKSYKYLLYIHNLCIKICRKLGATGCLTPHIFRNTHFGQMTLVTQWERTSRTESRRCFFKFFLTWISWFLGVGSWQNKKKTIIKTPQKRWKLYNLSGCVSKDKWMKTPY